ncbi:MAG: molybdate ABC transporter substrate-binding protein [Magnetospirillum sp. WYHS-4]
MKILFLSAVALGLAVVPARAAEVKAAVAANFTAPMKEIAIAFERASGHKASLSFGSTGKFYVQLANGAPFEVFLAADAEHPARAEAEGLAIAGTRFTYAVGKLVLWSAKPGLVDGRGEVLRGGGFNKLSIANPKTAPYGAAALDVLGNLGLMPGIEAKLVYGDSIAQAHQFVATGAADLGFVALAQVVLDGSGSRWPVPDHLYRPIVQQAVMLRPGAANPAAKALLAFLKTPEALAIVSKFGYAAE